MEIDTVEAALTRLRNQAKELAEFKRGAPKNKEQRFLALAIKAWVRSISQRALSIARLLEFSDLDSALVLIRTLREKSIDLILLCSWDQLEEAALRAHIYQRLQHRKLAKKNPDIGANPTLENMESDLSKFENAYPELFRELEEIAKQPPSRGHWSGLKPAKRIAKAAIVEPKGLKIQDLLSTEVHGSLDLAATRDCSPDMIIATADHVRDWIDEVYSRLQGIKA